MEVLLNEALHVNEELSNNINMTYTKPILNNTPLNQIQSTYTTEVVWDVDVCNATPSQQVDYNWLILDNSSNIDLVITDIFDFTTCVEIPITTTNYGDGKLFVPVDELAGGTCKTIKIKAQNLSCEVADIVVNQGWNCNAYPTEISTLTNCETPNFLRAIPEASQITTAITDLVDTPADPTDPSSGDFGNSTIDMCTLFPVEFNISNSDFATIYDVRYRVTLSNLGVGMSYVPNSATIEVEGVDVLNAPRLIDAIGESLIMNSTGGTWDIALSDLDFANFGNNQGLTGAGINPNNNEVTIRWLMEIDCDMISLDNITIESFANAPCLEPAIGNGNKIVSSPLNITNAFLPYSTVINSNISPDGIFENCDAIKTISVDASISGGVTGANDSLHVILPAGVYYDDNLNCSSANCVTLGNIQTVEGQQTISFLYPSGIINTTVSLEFDVISGNITCQTNEIQLKSVAQTSGLPCGTGTCPYTKVITGSVISGIEMLKPIYDLTFSLSSYDPVLDSYEYALEIQNSGITANESVTVDFYCVNEMLDGVDEAIGVQDFIVIPPIPSNTTYTTTGTLTGIACDVSRGIAAMVTPTSSPGDSNCFCANEDLTNLPIAMNQVFLAVDFISFTVSENNCRRQLNWTATDVEDLMAYEIMRSIDGNAFYTISTIDNEAINPLDINTYTYEDNEQICSANFYYKLKLINTDNTFEYSETTILQSDCYENIITPYPNPANSAFKLNFGEEHCTSKITGIKIYSAIGKFIRHIPVDDQIDLNALEIDIQDYKNGLYFINIEQAGELDVITKLIVNH